MRNSDLFRSAPHKQSETKAPPVPRLSSSAPRGSQDSEFGGEYPPAPAAPAPVPPGTQAPSRLAPIAPPQEQSSDPLPQAPAKQAPDVPSIRLSVLGGKPRLLLGGKTSSTRQQSQGAGFDGGDTKNNPAP
jgi:hypothetical protein